MSNSSNIQDILVPNLPDSVLDATVSVWHKKEGELIQPSEVLLEIETDKIMLEVPSSVKGILEVISEKEGSVVVSGQVLGQVRLVDDFNKDSLMLSQLNQEKICEKIIPSKSTSVHFEPENENSSNISNSPIIRKLIFEHNLDIRNIKGTGIKGRLTKKDVEVYIKEQNLLKNQRTMGIVDYSDQCVHKNVSNNNLNRTTDDVDYLSNRKESRVAMSRLRQKIAERLLYATNSSAILTTFNEVNMQSVILLRNKYKELFQKKHGIKLGFMSFYVKAVLAGLKRFPDINAFIDGNDIVYHNYFDINIAISTNRGLITPVLRDVNFLSIIDIEKKIFDLAERGRQGKLTLDELNGGSFTITNGGIFGSLISTPIINPPQSAILGMHAIKDRPMVLNDKIVILPMMYLALSYDHRLIDGKDSVSFLMTIKELIEDPMRLFLDI